MRFLVLLLAGCSGIGETHQELGEQKNGYPNAWERALLMAANRARSDPATVKGPQSAMYAARAPLVWDYDLSRAARFHATTLETGKAPLMHNSPCTLKSDVGTSGCIGTPDCACTTGMTCNSCGTCAAGTDPFKRVSYFYMGSISGEIAAAGYGDPFKTMDGWVDEAAGADGHRMQVNGANGLVGFGHAEGTAGACWQAFDVGDFGSDTPAAAKIASAANSGNKVYATWNDQGGAPKSLSVVVDGKCVVMTKELGDDKLNATYVATAQLGSGCHSIYILGSDSAGTRATYPTTTAFTVGCTQDEMMQPAADCDPSFMPPMPDLATSPAPQDPSGEIGGCDLAPGTALDGAWILVLLAAVRRLTRRR